MDVIEEKIHRKWLTEFLANCRHNNKSDKTLVNYSADLKRFVCWYEYVHGGHLNSARGVTITQYMDYLSGKMPLRREVWWEKLLFWRKLDFTKKEAYLGSLKPLNVSSKRRHLSTLNNFFTFLMQNYEDRSPKFRLNPVKSKLHSIRVKQMDISHTVYLKQTDWDLLESTTWRVRDRLILKLMYYAGLRLEEVVNLDISHFSFTKKTIKFVRKGGYVHELMPENFQRIFEDLYQWLGIRTKYGDPLFVNKKGKRMSVRGMYSLVMHALDKAKCPTKGLTPHSFRKACATNLYRQTKDLLYVRDYLNHKDAKVTQTYIENY